MFPGINATLFPAARPSNYREPQYVAEWRHWTEAIDEAVKEHCPDIATTEKLWYAPSFADSPKLSVLDVVKTWEAGLGKDRDLEVFGAHQ